MLAKLNRLPIASAMPSASSQPPRLRIEAVQKHQKDRKERTAVIRASASSQATHRGHPGKMQMVADEQRHRNARPLIEAVDRRNHDLEAMMVQAGMK